MGERTERTAAAPSGRPLVAQFERGMHQNSSGKYADGSLRRRFHVSVRHHPPASDVILRLSPLSRYDRTRLDVDPVVVHWRVGGGQNASSP